MGVWDADLYASRHDFVWRHGAGILEWLDARQGERIVDLGCGTGELTARLADGGALVEGLDASPEMIASARARFPNLVFRVADARTFEVDEPVDAVFSNAALHWVRPPEPLAPRVAAGPDARRAPPRRVRRARERGGRRGRRERCPRGAGSAGT
ncbi:class I SAM-dependent methyltransferase, partial [Deinococcus pimensis]|uniref:class I SAM-dependent methyltransferase n=1 Tax=Deinococcus pimensis TaxID=309888 RepID=UPI0012FCE697